MIQRSTIGCRRGLTLVELMLGLALLALVGAANAALLYAVGRSWGAAETDRANRMGGYQASEFLYRQLRSSRFVSVAHGGTMDGGAIRLGGAVGLWREDDVLVDGEMQYGEYAVLEHDEQARTLTYFSQPTTSAGAADRVPNGLINSASHAEAFKRRPNVVGRLVARDVKQVRFRGYAVNSNADARMLEFVIVIERDGQEQTEYGTATVRSPKRPTGAGPTATPAAAQAANEAHGPPTGGN